MIVTLCGPSKGHISALSSEREIPTLSRCLYADWIGSLLCFIAGAQWRWLPPSMWGWGTGERNLLLNLATNCERRGERLGIRLTWRWDGAWLCERDCVLLLLILILMFLSPFERQNTRTIWGMDGVGVGTMTMLKIEPIIIDSPADSATVLWNRALASVTQTLYTNTLRG